VAKIAKASREEIEGIISSIFEQKPFVLSLKELHEMVNKKLGNSRHISLSRLKRIAVSMKGIEVKIKKKIMRGKPKEKCPVCLKDLVKVFGKDVFNRPKHVGFRCKHCGFTCGLEYTLPRQYIFSKRR